MLQCNIFSAAIQELQRRANILPVNVVHRTVRDTSVKGVTIPADTLVLGEIHQILAHSPVFKDGHEYRPERFLMEDGVTPNKVPDKFVDSEKSRSNF
ncbi:hypothetical protein TELCIR_12629 [Teladorsagia circumcincta]|uniref:Uncharacterized protein n=1 Tax=Teladorsagia circumcincta TaxID=45464 RepID=A0A2G9U639_TELCI|nr:hypothetical protein TELCIR_12629 [Teladorsagia circumcincta]